MISLTSEVACDPALILEGKEYWESFVCDKKNEKELLGMPWAKFFTIMRIINTQRSASKIEMYLCNFYGWTHLKNNKKDGDAIDENSRSIEIKHSFITVSNNTLNIKQVRIDWDKSDYRVFALEKDKLYRFDLTHDQMCQEILIFGAAKTHKNGGDYSMSIPWNKDNVHYQRWMQDYLSDKPVPE